jgi:hypothetical protein
VTGGLIAVPAFLLFYNNTDFTGNTGTPGMLAEIGALRLYGLFAVGIVCWLTLFGIWGVLARYVRKESRVLRYLADASFWIYLVHIPFLVALQSTLGSGRQRNLRPGPRQLCPDPGEPQADGECPRSPRRQTLEGATARPRGGPCGVGRREPAARRGSAGRIPA